MQQMGNYKQYTYLQGKTFFSLRTQPKRKPSIDEQTLTCNKNKIRSPSIIRQKINRLSNLLRLTHRTNNVLRLQMPY